MTHPTKAIYKWLIQDAVRVGNTSSADQRTQLYTEADHNATFPRIEAIDYHTTHTISAIRITPYPAGHVLGAAMFLVEIAGLKILFTGDYSREEDRHLIAAAPPPGVAVDVLITESTFGIASHVPRVEREQALLHAVGGILGRGGRVLMPVSAVGRAQEVLLILDEHWAARPELQRVPIYYCGWLARKCMGVYQAYIGAMNDRIKRRFHELAAESERRGGSGSGGAVGGPWDLRYVRGLRSLERFDDAGGCVVLASPGMLQNGVSRELLERWAPNERNGVVVTGYSVEGTMAKDLLKEPDSIPAIMGPRGSGQGGAAAAWRGGRLTAAEERPMIPRRCSVQEFSFAAHVDGHENRAFIEEINAPVVVRAPLTSPFEFSLLPTSSDPRWNSILTTRTDPRARREAQHDAPQVQAALPQPRKDVARAHLQPGQRRGSPHPVPRRQDGESGGATRADGAADRGGGAGRRRGAAGVGRAGAERLQADADGAGGPARVRGADDDHGAVPAAPDAALGRRGPHPLEPRGHLWRRRGGQAEALGSERGRDGRGGCEWRRGNERRWRRQGGS